MITTETIHKHWISMFKPILFGLTPAKLPLFYCIESLCMHTVCLGGREKERNVGGA